MLNANKVPSGGKQFEPQLIEAGTYPSRLVQVIDLGLQAQRPYQGQEKKPAREIMLTYELSDEFMKDEEGNDLEDKPRWLSENIPLHNLSNDKAKSTKRYYALDPKNEANGDWSQLVTTPCMVTVVSNENKSSGKTYNNISSVSSMRPREAANLPELKNPPKVFDLDSPDLTIFLSLPEWLQNKIKDNLEFGGSKLEKLLSSDKTPKKESKKEVVKEEVEEVVETSDEGEDW